MTIICHCSEHKNGETSAELEIDWESETPVEEKKFDWKIGEGENYHSLYEKERKKFEYYSARWKKEIEGLKREGYQAINYLAEIERMKEISQVRRKLVKQTVSQWKNSAKKYQLDLEKKLTQQAQNNQSEQAKLTENYQQAKVAKENINQEYRVLKDSLTELSKDLQREKKLKQQLFNEINQHLIYQKNQAKTNSQNQIELQELQNKLTERGEENQLNLNQLTQQQKEWGEERKSWVQQLEKAQTECHDLAQKYLGAERQIRDQVAEIERLTEQQTILKNLAIRKVGDLKVKKNILELQLESLANYSGKSKKEAKNLTLKLEWWKNTSKKHKVKLNETAHKLFLAEEENQMLRYKVNELKGDLISANRKKSELRNRLIEIKRSHKANTQKAQELNLCQTLIKYETIKEDGELENDKEKTLNQAISQSVSSLIEVVANCQQHLKVNNLTQIKTSHPMPRKKSLGDLITFYLDNKDKVLISPSQPRIVEKVIINETAIVNQIISQCDLGLAENSSLTQVIEQINKLIKPNPPVIANQPKDTPFGESLEKIVEIDLQGLEKELGIRLSREVEQQIRKVNNYQELSLLRNREIKSYLEKIQGSMITSQPSKEPATLTFKVERIIWISLLATSLIAMGKLLIRQKKRKLK
ncbi:MAG: hypothetical protein I3273_05395 [Candidatus Moeniiplasma glomeromycotorum]|nr:hypothetical protein [Candidatus Moeniiplasma glomeromycotorum]